MFRNPLDKNPELNNEQKKDYNAQIDFLLAYYHFLLYRCYGPISLIKEEPNIQATQDQFVSRTPLDECTTWIADKFDEAAKNLPEHRASKSEFGLATSVAAKALKAIHFFMKNRNHGNRSNPNKMEILMSDDFNGNFNPEENKAVLVKALTGLPDGQGAEYTSPAMLAPKAYQYVWFKITEVYNRQNYAAISELQVYAHKTSIFDPETGKTIVE